MTNGQVERALALDPRVQEALFPPDVRESEEFKALMELVARSKYFSTFTILAAITIAVRGERALQSLILASAVLQLHPAFSEMVEAAEKEAALKGKAA